MIDWSSVKSVSIPEGNVKQIDIDGATVWTKQQSRLPDGFQELTYIGCSGSQFINTLIKPSANSAFYIRYQETTASGSNYAFGSRDSSRILYGVTGGTATHNVSVVGHTAKTPDNYRSIGNIYEITASYNASTTGTSRIRCETTGDVFDGVQSATYGDSVGNIFICAHRTANRHGGMNVFEVKIWNDDVLERHLIPCRRISDNVLGMYDLVYDIFYANVGSGEFIPGEVVN